MGQIFFFWIPSLLVGGMKLSEFAFMNETLELCSAFFVPSHVLLYFLGEGHDVCCFALMLEATYLFTGHPVLHEIRTEVFVFFESLPNQAPPRAVRVQTCRGWIPDLKSQMENFVFHLGIYLALTNHTPPSSLFVLEVRPGVGGGS